MIDAPDRPATINHQRHRIIPFGVDRDAIYEKEEKVVYTQEPHTGFWRRFGVSFMSILPIESQL